mgnify:CR=1 FL=1
MKKLIVNGAEQLYGEVSAGGAKNAAVAIIPATVLARGRCVLENVPDIHDTELLFSMLRAMGATVEKISRTSAIIDTSTLTESTVPYELSKHMRASYYFIGSLLGRFGQACVSMPGGCNFGVRPIDQHIKGFEAMGAMVEQAGGYVCADAPKGGLRGGHVYLDIVSVGATMNILLAAVLCSGMTIIENCAKEPHIVDLANFLNAMGAQISGAGTDVIKVRGVKALHGGCYSIIPDQIEAGTYMAAAAAVGRNITPADGETSPSTSTASPPSCVRSARTSRSMTTPSASNPPTACTARTSRPCRTPASRPICSRRSPSVWPPPSAPAL